MESFIILNAFFVIGNGDNLIADMSTGIFLTELIIVSYHEQ